MKWSLSRRTVKRGAIGAAVAAAGFLAGVFFTSTPTAHDSHPHEATRSAADEGEKAATLWTCSMHPQIRQPEPGSCPICGMDLIPLKNDEDAPGPDTVVLSERAKILSRIQTVKVGRATGQKTTLRLLGRIEPSETSLRNVTAWTGGRIDKLNVKVTGQTVHKGQVIASLYSPEVYAAHQDLIVAVRQANRVANASESVKTAALRAVEASKNRLRLIGVPDDEIERMASAEKPVTAVAIRTPFSGTVMQRVATEGSYVSTGALLYTIADLSRLWVQLDAYEDDLAGIGTGQGVVIHIEGISDETFEGEVDFIDPTVDPMRRTARVRVAVKNRDRRLRPGMFVEAELKSLAEKETVLPLVVPSTAPLFTGRRAVVFVEDPGADRPTYRAKTVRLGPKTGDVYPVVAGLSEGDKVVVKGAFTLDADLQIRGGDSMMSMSDDTTMEDDTALALPAKERSKIAPVFERYSAVQIALAQDSVEVAKKEAAQMATVCLKTRFEGPQAAVAFWNAHAKTIAGYARELASAADIEKARETFEQLSLELIVLAKRLGNPLDKPIRLTFCPMAMGSKGAFWLQQSEVVDNPYFGAMMRTCGEIRETVEPGAMFTKGPGSDEPPMLSASELPKEGRVL